MKPLIQAGELDRLVRFKRPVSSDSLTGAGSRTWQPVATVAARVRDVRPGRERAAEGVTITSRQADIVVRYRNDVTSDMQIEVGRKVGADFVVDRTLEIIVGPVELGRRQWLEMRAEDFAEASA